MDNNNQNINNGVVNTQTPNVVNQPQPINNGSVMPNNQVSANTGYSAPVQNVPQPQPVYNQPVASGTVNYQPVQPQPQPQPVQPQPVNNVNPANMNAGYVQQPVANGTVNYQPQPNNAGFYNGTSTASSSNGKKGKIAVIALAIALIVLLVNVIVFSNKGASGHKNPQYDRTIMIYMVGSNLEEGLGLATLDLNGINYLKLTDSNTKLIVIAGGAKTWHNTYIDVNSTSIYELTETGYKKVNEQSLTNMGDAKVLSNFLNYGYDNYPSQKYDLIFWDHGMGFIGGEHDSIADDYLFLTETRSALKNSRFGKNNKLELVFFRTCLNGTIEVADTLKDYSYYMVASQEITNGYKGDNFLKVLNTVSKTDTAEQFGRKYVDGYMTYINNLTQNSSRYSNIYSTYSVINLTKLDAVEDALNDFFKDINSTSNYSQVAKARANMLQYGGEDPSYDEVDLYTLIYKLQSLSPSKASKLLSALDEAIVYSRASDERSKGLSIYFPYNGDSSVRAQFLNKLYDFNNLSKYKEFVTSFNKMRSSNAAPLSFAANTVDLNYNSKSGEADFQLKLTDGQAKTFTRAEYIVFQKTGENSYLPVYYSKNVKNEDNTLKANVKDRQLKVVDKSDKSQQVLTLIEEKDANDYVLYYTLVLLSNYDINYNGEDLEIIDGKLYLKLDKKTNKVSTEGLFIKPSSEESNNSIASDPYNMVANLEDYKYVTFSVTSRKILNSDGEYSNDWVDDEAKVWQAEAKNISFSLEDYTKNKNYYAIFRIYDIYGNASYSKLIDLK